MNRRQLLRSLLVTPFIGTVAAVSGRYRPPLGKVVKLHEEFYIDGREVAASVPARVMVDEVHWHKSRGLYDELVQKHKRRTRPGGRPRANCNGSVNAWLK